jgi:hypothetical protein
LTFGSAAGHPLGFTTGHDGASGGAASGGGAGGGGDIRCAAAAGGASVGGGGGGCGPGFAGDALHAAKAMTTAARSTRRYYGILVYSREKAFCES